MLVEKVIGNINDEQFKNSNIDYVDIEWHEAFKKLHKKTSKNGVDVGIKLDNYKDYSHYLEKINEYIAEKMKRESKLLNKDNYKEYFSNAREFFMNYNYDEIFY